MPNEMQMLISEISKQIGSTSLTARYVMEDMAWHLDTIPASDNGPYRIPDATDQSLEEIVDEAIEWFNQ